MAAMQFPTAYKCEPIYRIDGALYQHVGHAIGQRDPNAIRALVPKPNGEHAVKWFSPFDPPAADKTAEEC